MSFIPASWLPNRHLMTIYASVARWPQNLPVRRERWELADGDFLDVDRIDGDDRQPLLLVLHGLEGSSQAGYVRGVLAEAHARGLSAVALNFRGCSGELNRLARFYHSGDTGDLAYAIDRLAAERPGRPILLAGFSLGGNVVAKYLGERPAAKVVRAAAVVSVPFDLARCARALDGPGWPAWVYRERFLKQLRPKALAKAARFPGTLDAARIRAARSFAEFDEHVTARLHGFAGAEDYWARSSSGQFLGAVDRPLLILSAEDDPFVPADSLPVAAAQANPHITLEVSASGGHVAFVSGPPWRPHRWAERRLVEFLAR